MSVETELAEIKNALRWLLRGSFMLVADDSFEQHREREKALQENIDRIFKSGSPYQEDKR